MSADSGENVEMASNQASLFDVPSPHTFRLPEQTQSVDLISVLGRMNESIVNSNNLILKVLKDQGRQRRPPYVPESDSDEGDCDEPPLKKKRAGITPGIHSKSIVEPEIDKSDIASSPAPLIVGHTMETHPSVDDVVSLFGEQDIDEEVNAVEPDSISQDHFLTEVENAVATAKATGPPISGHLANIVNTKFHVELEPAQRKAILEKYLVPENCSGLYRPRINHEIWNSLRPSSKIADIFLTMLQDALITASRAVATSVEDILKCRESKTSFDFQNIVSRQSDIITLLGFVTSELSYRRKEALRPSIAPEFKSACSRTTKPTMFLFGDDLPKVMQKVRTTNRLLSNNFTVTRPHRRGGNVRMNIDNNHSNSFLFQRGRMAYPP